jgi:hypothetical protein
MPNQPLQLPRRHCGFSKLNVSLVAAAGER